MTNQNFKIVCIVSNSDEYTNVGLVRAFNHNWKTVLNSFIMTYLYKFDGRSIKTHFGYDTQKKYLLINEDNVEVRETLNGKENWEILFVCETVSLKNYSSFIDENTLVMFHSTPFITNEHSIAAINGIGIKKGKKGCHEQDESHGYKRLLKLTEAWENGSFNKEKYAEAKQSIIDWFGVYDELNELLTKFRTADKSEDGTKIKKEISLKLTEYVNNQKQKSHTS